jgi:hypothetical protein
MKEKLITCKLDNNREKNIPKICRLYGCLISCKQLFWHKFFWRHIINVNITNRLHVDDFRWNFSAVIFFWSFGIIDASTIKCWELSTAQAGARGREGCCMCSLSLMYRLKQTRVRSSLVILLWLMPPRDHFVSRFLFNRRGWYGIERGEAFIRRGWYGRKGLCKPCPFVIHISPAW